MADILADSSALYALADGDDKHHAEALAVLESLSPEDSLVLPNFLLAESHTIINKRLGPQAAKVFLNAALQDYRIESVTSEDEMAAHAILQDVTRSRDFSYFDAVAAALALRLGIKRVFTFDRHFRQMGFELLKT